MSDFCEHLSACVSCRSWTDRLGHELADYRKRVAALEAQLAQVQGERDAALARERQSEENSFECFGCGCVVSGEPGYSSPPHADDGLPDIYCKGCHRAGAENDKVATLTTQVRRLRVVLEKCRSRFKVLTRDSADPIVEMIDAALTEGTDG